MKLDKKQVPQLIVLGLLVLMCIGYVSFTVFKKPATESAPPAKADSTNTPKATVRVASEPIPVTGTFPDLNAPIPRRDPFTVQHLGSEHPAPPVVQPIVNKPTATAHPFHAPAIKVPPLIPVGSFSQSPTRGSASMAGLEVVPSIAERDPDFVLTGVIRGAENVAVIRVGNLERHVVMQGQTIDGRYKVLTVTEDGVVLGCKDRRIHLKLGGVRNAS